MPNKPKSIYATESEARAICAKWSKAIGLGWHLDTPASDYEPALAIDIRDDYDADMARLLASDTPDPYEIALEEALREAKD
jgi:hypothetical protein